MLAAAAVITAFVAGVWMGGSAETTSTTASGSATSTTGPPGEASTTTSGTTASDTSTLSSVTTPGIDDLPDEWVAAQVVQVIDGDTIDVHLVDGGEERVRLIGINAPEEGECFSERATDGLSDLVTNATVYLERDVSERDQFGRLLRYVWITEDRLVNVVAMEEGWAVARDYPPDTARSEQLRAAEARARESGSGLWGADACGETTPADMRIVHVEFDAEGDDNFNLNGEWVELINADDVPVDLTGWVLRDESASHRFGFPGGFSLAPGAQATVFTGCGDDTGSALYWCETGSAVWNNSGDTAFLLDPEGNIVFSYAYG